MNLDYLSSASRTEQSGTASQGMTTSPWLAGMFAVLALVIGGVIALVVGQIGYLSLLAIPVAFIFASALVQPELGLMALIFITVTQISNVAIKFYGLPSLAQPLVGMLMLVVLIRFALHGERPTGWARIGAILAAFVVLWLASLLHASDFEAAREAFVGFGKDMLVGVIVIFLVYRPASLRGAVWAFILAGIVMGSISVYQYLTGSFNNILWGFGGIEGQVSGQVERTRLTGPYQNPNAYAQVLGVIVPLALDRLWHERSVLLRVLAGWAAAACILAVFFTYSRGGLLAMAAGIAVLLLTRRPGIFPLILTAALLYGLLSFLPATYTERVATLLQLRQSDQIYDPSFRGRLSENTAALQMFWDHPLLGVGLGNFPVNYQDYSRQIGIDPRRDPRSPASLYLEMLSEQGIIGASLFVLLIILVFRGLWMAKHQFQYIGMRDAAYMTSAVFAALSAYMTSAIVKNSAYSNVFWILMGVALATTVVARISYQEAEETRVSGAKR